jgi:hypothetical protein
MANRLLTNLHKSAADLTESSFLSGIRTKIQEFGNKMPNLMGSVDVTGHFKIKQIKQSLLKKLNKKRQKFKLALEALGWGTLAELLESAFCGQELDVWV